MMIRATTVAPAGTWSGPAADTVVLDYDNRYRRRIAMRGEGGLDFLLDLAEARPLSDGDGLMLDDGRIVAVTAASEHLLQVTCDDPADLIRVAWHLGNRHLETQLLENCLRIREDRVIAQMLQGLGAHVTPVDAPFAPETGAYAHGKGHEHDHGHDGPKIASEAAGHG